MLRSLSCAHAAALSFIKRVPCVYLFPFRVFWPWHPTAVLLTLVWRWCRLTPLCIVDYIQVFCPLLTPPPPPPPPSFLRHSGVLWPLGIALYHPPHYYADPRNICFFVNCIDQSLDGSSSAFLVDRVALIWLFVVDWVFRSPISLSSSVGHSLSQCLVSRSVGHSLSQCLVSRSVGHSLSQCLVSRSVGHSLSQCLVSRSVGHSLSQCLVSRSVGRRRLSMTRQRFCLNSWFVSVSV